MNTGKTFLICCLLLGWFYQGPAMAQSIATIGQVLEKIPKFRPDADTSLNVSKLSKISFYQLIDQLYQIDQKYRHQYMTNKNSVAETEIGHRMKVNDEANQYLLLKGLQAFGWPTDYDPAKPAFDSRSCKAWCIVHHTSNVAPQLEQQLRPYIEAAYRKGSFSKQFWQLYLSFHL